MRIRLCGRSNARNMVCCYVLLGVNGKPGLWPSYGKADQATWGICKQDKCPSNASTEATYAGRSCKITSVLLAWKQRPKTPLVLSLLHAAYFISLAWYCRNARRTILHDKYVALQFVYRIAVVPEWRARFRLVGSFLCTYTKVMP